MTRQITIVCHTCCVLLLYYYLPAKAISAPYTRYEFYPKYCSIPSEIQSRRIRPVEKNNTRLIQVNAIIRHGSRTPYFDGEYCWKGYRSKKADTSKWDCGLKTVQAAPTSRALKAGDDGFEMMFEKKYDALKSPLRNELNGTCQLGQLLETGYDQEFENGKILKEAYLNESRMNMYLFNGILANETYMEPFTYYRADDFQRTMMSGQILLSGLFGNDNDDFSQNIKIKVHTADRSNDILEGNFHLCPKLNDLASQAYASPDFIQKNTSEDASKLRNMLKDELKSSAPSNGREPIDVMVDCLMTTICTDRSLPILVNDFDGNEDGSSLFMRLIKFATWKWLFLYQFNDAAFPKLAMGPLWTEIMDRIRLTLRKDMIDDEGNTGSNDDIPRLLLYSAHDVTILSLLATLGFDIMNMSIPAYASLLIIEIHAVLENPAYDSLITSRAFRLLYNGETINRFIKGCPKDEELCDLQILMNLVEPFATRDRDCMSSLTSRTTAEDDSFISNSPMVSVTIVLFSCLIGVMVTYTVLSKKVNEPDETIFDDDNYDNSKDSNVMREINLYETEVI